MLPMLAFALLLLASVLGPTPDPQNRCVIAPGAAIAGLRIGMTEGAALAGVGSKADQDCELLGPAGHGL